MDHKSIVVGVSKLSSNIQLLQKSIYEEFPAFEMAIGYGSGVVPQIGYDYDSVSPLMDLLIVVDDVYEWHSKNWRINRHHYSGIFQSLYLKFSWLQKCLITIRSSFFYRSSSNKCTKQKNIPSYFHTRYLTCKWSKNKIWCA